jgi:hypothetical protein
MSNERFLSSGAVSGVVSRQRAVVENQRSSHRRTFGNRPWTATGRRLTAQRLLLLGVSAAAPSSSRCLSMEASAKARPTRQRHSTTAFCPSAGESRRRTSHYRDIAARLSARAKKLLNRSGVEAVLLNVRTDQILCFPTATRAKTKLSLLARRCPRYW